MNKNRNYGIIKSMYNISIKILNPIYILINKNKVFRVKKKVNFNKSSKILNINAMIYF